mgnify:CR=1 FL=1
MPNGSSSVAARLSRRASAPRAMPRSSSEYQLRAVAWLGQQRGGTSPFFLYFAPVAVHELSPRIRLEEAVVGDGYGATVRRFKQRLVRDDVHHRERSGGRHQVRPVDDREPVLGLQRHRPQADAAERQQGGFLGRAPAGAAQPQAERHVRQ